MFNRDIAQFFKQADIRPTDDFRSNLRKRVLAERASQTPSRSTNWFRVLSVGTASLALAAVVLNLAFAPNHSNAVLAEAMENTFGLEDGKYHHQKMVSYTNYDGYIYHQTTEYWQDDDRLIADIVDHDEGDIFSSRYTNAEQDTTCVISWKVVEPTCAQPTFIDAIPLRNDGSLKIHDIKVEPAVNDPYGDVYLTWFSDHIMEDSVLYASGANEYGLEHGKLYATYGWIGDDGRAVNRVTLRSNDYLQSDFNPMTSRVMVQISNDGKKSSVYVVDVGDYSVRPISDEEIDGEIESLRIKYVDYLTSVAPIRKQYETEFINLFDIQQKLAYHTEASAEDITVNGHDVHLITYTLDPTKAVSIQGADSARAEFAIDQETDTILWFNLFDANGNTLQHVELLIQEERNEAPEGVFDLDTWKARVISRS